MNPDYSETTGAPHLLCLGLGYTARALALKLAPRGIRISGSSRSAEGAAALARDGFAALLIPETGNLSDAALATVSDATHVLLSAPPDETGDPILRRLGRHIEASRRLRWIGYLSTVGVYGDAAGGWVDETTPARPASQRGARRLAAETAWLALGARTGVRVEVFRLPGIYGPGRSAFDQLRAGSARRIVKPGQVFNRMHVDDIAGALAAAIDAPPGHAVYNLVDDEPAPPQDVVSYAAGLLGLPPPPEVGFADAPLSPMARSFYGESKRVSNRRMHADLGYRPVYPTYREGLVAILRAGG